MVVFMDEKRKNELKKRIIEEMTVDYSSSLEKNFDLAKQFIRITKTGKVNVLFKDKLTGKDQILLYLIGKRYTKEAGYSATDDAGNKELMNELGIPEGSLLPWLKDLRDSNQIRKNTRDRYSYHYIPINFLERTLKNMSEKLNKELHGE